MLYLLTCTAYWVIFIIDIICTNVSYCEDCIVIGWFTLVLILFTSFVVAVPISHLRLSLRKGNKLLLWQVFGCDFPLKEGLVLIKLIVDIIVGLQELYMSSMFES